MKVNKFSALSAVFILLISIFTIMCRPYVVAQELGTAALTGNVLDRGVDTNGNGLYNYLEIDVEINVTVSGNFQVAVGSLMDASNNYISVYKSSEGVLDTGVQYLNVSLSSAAIFSSGLNPQKISWISLSTQNQSDYMYLNSIYNVALSRVYNHSEFDPHAYLTGHISDQGIDTDGDGLFNYLEVGIEFNVTQAGQYQISAEGLAEKTGSTTNYFYDFHSEQDNFAIGDHVFYVNFSGPGIAYSHLNPTDVNNMRVYDMADGVQTSWLEFAHLSKQYSNTLFNAPSENIDVHFKVYPDATVAVDGTASSAHMYPENSGPQTNVTVGFSTIGNVTTETSNGIVVFPQSQFNNNTIEAHLRSTYGSGLENDILNSSLVLTPEEAAMYPFNTTDFSLDAAYSGGLFDVGIAGQTVAPSGANGFLPFNMSDVTLRAGFDGTELTGNITFHSIAGFPFADVTVYFSGNRTNLSFSGNFNVTYVSYGGLEINQTVLDQEITDLTANFTGQGAGSLYNESLGYVECTDLNLTKIPWSNPSLGADVTYNATVIGNFTAVLAAMMFPSQSQNGDVQRFAYACLESASSSVRNASLILNYYHSSQTATFDLHLTCDGQALWSSLLVLGPPATPPSWSLQQTQVEAWLKLANSTMWATTEAIVNASYSSADRKMVMNAWLLANASQLKNDLVSILPNMARADMQDLIESYLNTTYATLDSSTSTFDMVNETATFSSEAILQGDLEAQLNLAKRVLIQVLYPSPLGSPPLRVNPPVPWDISMLNGTEINIDNFQAEFELGTDWAYANFSGLILKPQPDNVDSTTFKLKTWLNEANDPNAPPLEFEKLSVTITGGSSDNQTVLLSTPSGVPSTDYSSTDNRIMSWNNASLVSLKDLMFLTALENHITYGGKQYDIDTLTNSTVKNLVFDPDARKITFNVTGPTGTEGFCNVTIPRSLFQSSSLSDWTVTFDGRLLGQGEFNITQNADYVFLYLNYAHSEHVIEINVPPVISEYRPDFLPIASAIALVVVAIVAFGQRRKLHPMKTKCHQMLAHARLVLRIG